MDSNLLRQLRELASVRGKQKTWVSGLPDEQLHELFVRLRNGEAAKSIARHIQQGWKIRRKSSIHSLSQGILKYKGRIDHLLVSPAVEDSFHLSAPDDELDDLEKLEHIAHLQQERIQRMMEEEQETGIRNPNMSKEISALTSLTKAITKARDWELKFGDSDPIKRKRMERRERRVKEVFDSMISKIDADGRARVVNALDRFLELAEENAVVLKKGPDGQYYPVDQPPKSAGQRHAK